MTEPKNRRQSSDVPVWPLGATRSKQLFDELREASDVYFSPELERWILTRFEDVGEVLRDDRLGVDPRKALEATGLRQLIPLAEMGNLTFLDPPEHTAIRRSVAHVFTPKFVESFRPGITQLIETLLDRIPPGPFDFGASMAKPLSIRVVACLLIGLAESDLPTFMSYLPEVSQIFNPSFPKERALAAREKLKDLWRAIVDSRRKAPREDFASILVKAMEAGELPEGALLETLTVTFVAGNMSTAEMMKNTLLQLLRHPLELEKIERDPSLLKNAIEEALRLDGPIASINRVAPEDMEVRGCPVRRGQVVSVLVGPAARGPEVNDDPQTFDITRQKIKHLAFGAGQHFCIGAPLARLETELVLDALFRRFPNLRLDPDRPPAPQNSPMVNGVDAIWVIP